MSISCSCCSNGFLCQANPAKVVVAAKAAAVAIFAADAAVVVAESAVMAAEAAVVASSTVVGTAGAAVQLHELHWRLQLFQL